MRSTSRRAALVAAIALTLAACGGESGPSADEFIDELDDICRDLQADIDDLGDPTDYASLEDLAGQARDIFEEYLDAMQALEAPEDLQRDFDDFLELVEENSDLVRDLGRAASNEDDAEITSLNETLGTLREDRNAAAEDLGADRCISDDEETPDTGAPDTAAPDTAAPTTAPTTTVAPTTDAPVTAPPISQVPITSPTTIAVDPQGIGTIDIVGGFNPPAGFQFQDPGDDTLQTIKDAFAETPSLAGAVASVGSALVVDETNTVAAVMFLTFWTSDISGTATQQAFENEITSTSATFSNEVTPAGLDHILYADPDGKVGLVATSTNVSLWLIVDTGQEEFVQLLADDFLAANND